VESVGYVGWKACERATTSSGAWSVEQKVPKSSIFQDQRFRICDTLRRNPEEKNYASLRLLCGLLRMRPTCPRGSRRHEFYYLVQYDSGLPNYRFPAHNAKLQQHHNEWPNSITVTGFADEDLNTLALKASGTYSEPSAESFYTQLGIVAQLSDTFIINDPRLNGTVGFLEMPFSFTGTVMGASARGGLEVILGDSVGGSSGACTLNVSACLFLGNASVLAGDPATGAMSFHYGSPFTLTWGLAPTFFPQQATSGSSDYSHTGVFQGFRLFDSNQQAVYDATIVGSGGEQVALLTPEPSLTIPVVVCLMLIGLAKVSLRKKAFSS
jgi:hypothetical protein